MYLSWNTRTVSRIHKIKKIAAVVYVCIAHVAFNYSAVNVCFTCNPCTLLIGCNIVDCMTSIIAAYRNVHVYVIYTLQTY